MSPIESGITNYFEKICRQSNSMLATVQPRRGGFLERLHQFSGAFRGGIVRVFALVVRVVNDQAETGFGIADGCVLKHGVITIAIPKASDGATAQELVNTDGLSFFIVDK